MGINPASLPGRMLGSLSFRLSFPVGLVIFCAVALYATWDIYGQQARMTERMKRESLGFAETLRRTTFRTMLSSERGHLYEHIRDMASQPGVDRVRIVGPTGRISYSSHGEETGRMVDKRAEACYGCHKEAAPLTRLPSGERTRIFTSSAGHRVMGTILPIYNRPVCSNAACHAHPASQRVLGVLDVDLTLKEMDAFLAQEQRRTLWFALILFLGASTMVGISVILTVNRTVRRLSREVDKLAAGDVYSVTTVKAPAELGRLADSIAYLAQRVARRTEAMNRRYRQWVEDSPEAILVLDKKGRLVVANPEAGRVMERDPEGLVGLPLADLIVKEDRPELLQALEEARARQGVCHLIRLRFRRAGGGMRVLEGRFRGFAGSSKSGGLVGNLVDITVRRDLEARMLKQAGLAAVGHTVAGLVPYLRNLLHGLKNSAYIMDQGIESEDVDLVKQGEALMERNLAKFSHVAEDILYYADYGIERCSDLDLGQLFAEVYGLAASRADEVGVGIELQAPEQCRRVRLDHEGMRRALLNLVNNAVDALAEAGGKQKRVRISCLRRGTAQVEITVSDNGPGIPEDVRTNLFTGLFSTKGAAGTGMGLLLCQKIVAEHGGYIKADHAEEGGAAFTMVLPQPPSVSAVAPPPPRGGAGA